MVIKLSQNKKDEVSASSFLFLKKYCKIFTIFVIYYRNYFLSYAKIEFGVKLQYFRKINYPAAS